MSGATDATGAGVEGATDGSDATEGNAVADGDGWLFFEHPQSPRSPTKHTERAKRILRMFLATWGVGNSILNSHPYYGKLGS